ncbi:MAG: hypothetical protein U0792_25755 [Gemmataceae bacterium]
MQPRRRFRNQAAALRYLGNALFKLDEHAADYDTSVLYEPLNRHETNPWTTQAEGVALLSGSGVSHTKLLCDLYHEHRGSEPSLMLSGLQEVRWPRALRRLEPPRRRA